ncbi:MAG: hypothetical protein LBK47_07610 [Prevotellaceae bacterium]|jgi:V/A-type H+-transporting ATPase subunit E|nr:hypothetical protein [Prevotellaceae bacterium]
MQDKLALLTEKLYGEGVEKGRKAADELLAKAQAEASAIVDKARKEAARILDKAQREAVKTQETSNNEIITAGNNTVHTVKLELENVLLNSALADSVATAFADAEFLKSLVLAATERFNVNATEPVNLSILLPADKQAELEKRFVTSAKNILDKGLELKFDRSVRAGFKIGPKNGGYYLSFTGQDFVNLFKEYLRPQVRTLLFGTDIK